jgi:hypothetical protein
LDEWETRARRSVDVSVAHPAPVAERV